MLKLPDTETAFEALERIADSQHADAYQRFDFNGRLTRPISTGDQRKAAFLRHTCRKPITLKEFPHEKD